jgi:NTP pyrophosphatase (non-canonical NTP hydrolase)
MDDAMARNTGDSLRDLAQSTLAFFARFGVKPTVNDCVQNLREEVAELIEAAQIGTDQNHTAEEAADVFVTAIGICYAAGVDIDRLVEQIYAVIAKNDAKNHQTHVYSDGKIRRRAPK